MAADPVKDKKDSLAILDETIAKMQAKVDKLSRYEKMESLKQKIQQLEEKLQDQKMQQMEEMIAAQTFNQEMEKGDPRGGESQGAGPWDQMQAMNQGQPEGQNQQFPMPLTR